MGDGWTSSSGGANAVDRYYIYRKYWSPQVGLPEVYWPLKFGYRKYFRP